MNTSELRAQSLSPRPCSMFTDGIVPQNSHIKQTDTVLSNVTNFTPHENGRVKCNENQVN